jgi:hypothetical protein
MAIEFEDLSPLEQEIWRIGASQSETDENLRLVLISHKSKDYLFIKENGTLIEPASLYSTHKAVTFERVFISFAWNAHFDGYSHHNIGFGLFVVKGFSSRDEMIRATLANIRHEVTVITLNEGPTPEISERVHFEPMVGFGERNGAKVRKFFRERRIVSGTYRIASINSYLLYAVLNPLAIKKFLETGVVPEGYFEFPYDGVDVECPNWLEYSAENDRFDFKVQLHRDANSSEDELLEKVKSILNFTFRDIEPYMRANGEDESLLEIFGCSLEEFHEIWEAFRFWNTNDDRKGSEEETWDTVTNWIRPDTVNVTVSTWDIDPSRGTRVWKSTGIDELSETFDEWLHVNFEHVQSGAYLQRLREQSRKMKNAAGSIAKASYLHIPIEDIDCSIRTYNCLKRAGIDTLGELIALNELELLAIKNLGTKGVAEIPERIAGMGLGHLVSDGSWPFAEK